MISYGLTQGLRDDSVRAAEGCAMIPCGLLQGRLDDFVRASHVSPSQCRFPRSPTGRYVEGAWQAHLRKLDGGLQQCPIFWARSGSNVLDRNGIAMEGGMNIIEKPAERKCLRLKLHDYSQSGAYFLTIGTHRMECLFGHIIDEAMHLNDLGRAVERAWFGIPRHFPRAVLDEFVVMPNHVHGIVILMSDQGDSMSGEIQAPEVRRKVMPRSSSGVSQRGPKRGSIAAIVGAFKSAASRCINEVGRGGRGAIWHRNYYEYVVRNEESLTRIREYIRANPQLWAKDRFNPAMRPW